MDVMKTKATAGPAMPNYAWPVQDPSQHVRDKNSGANLCCAVQVACPTEHPQGLEADDADLLHCQSKNTHGVRVHT